jgi:hypothetical protein
MEFSPFPAKFNRAMMVLGKGISYVTPLSSAFNELKWIEVHEAVC